MTKRAWGAKIQNREEKFELKRRAVLLSAARIIRTTGFDGMSLGDIAVDLNVAKPTVYYYFRNKEEIVRELMEQAVITFLNPDDVPEDFPDHPEMTGLAQFERFVRRCVRITADGIGACLFVVYYNQLAGDLRRELETIGEPIINLGYSLLHKGMTDGSIRKCDPVIVYNFVTNGLRAGPLLTEMGRGNSDEIADAFVALVTRGIKADA